MFGHDWEPTTATITMARVRGIGGKTGMKTIFEFEADVAPPGGGERSARSSMSRTSMGFVLPARA
jgi:hypothetical protein